MDIVAEIGEVAGMETKELVSMYISIHKDNAGALILAETIPPQFTLKSKYYAIKTFGLERTSTSEESSIAHN